MSQIDKYKKQGVKIITASSEKIKLNVGFPFNSVALSLVFIGLIALILRLSFLYVELPLNSDNFLYFIYAIDHSLGKSSDEYFVNNNGWPLFLSFFFSIFSSNNFMDYMALQRYLSVAISVLTIIPIYFLCKRFVDKPAAIIGSAIFVLEPRIVQNSLFGITEPLYIIMLTMSLALFFSTREKLLYPCFAILALLVSVRLEGLFLYPAFALMFFYRYKINKKSLIKFGTLTVIFILIILATGMFRTQETGDDRLLSRFNESATEITSSPETSRAGGSIPLVFSGMINMTKFLGWSMIPYLIFFVPLGFILLVKKRTADDRMLLILAVFVLLPTIFAYSYASDSRYLFPLYPIFAVMTVYSIAFFYKKINSKTVLNIALIASLLILSTGFLIWKNIDFDHEMESWRLASEVTERVKAVNIYYPESAYLSTVGLTKVDSFPMPSNEFRKMNPLVIDIRKSKSLSEMLHMGEEKGLTHLVVDDSNNPDFLNDIFYNEGNYTYFTRIYDSKENGYKHHIKIFEIDYEMYKQLND